MSEELKANIIQEESIEKFKKLNLIATTMFDVLLETDVSKVLATPILSFDALVPVASLKLIELNSLVKNRDLDEKTVEMYLLKLIEVYRDIKLLEKMIDETVKVDL